MRKALKSILFLLIIPFAETAYAQWSGPTGNVLSTGNAVKISQVGGTSSCGGCPPIAPILETSLTGMPGTLFPFVVSYSGKVGIGTSTPGSSLHLANSGDFKITRTDGSSICYIDPIGSFRFTTDGTANQFRGLFLNNQNDDFFKVSETELAYTRNANEVLKVDNHVNVKGDLIVKDLSNNIQFRVYQDGLVRAREVKVNLATIPPDYVFEKSYHLLSLAEVEEYITKHKHLPNVPSAADMTKAGEISLQEMQFKLLEKVEELTLYVIELKRENEELKSRLCDLEKQ